MLELAPRRRAGRDVCATSPAARTTSPTSPTATTSKFLKTTKASFTGDPSSPHFEFEDVDTQFIKPRPRRYDATK